MNDDLESRLRDALRARAERTPIAGDGLDRIRLRTGRRRMSLVQPVIAAGALTALVVAGVATGMERDHGGHPDVVLPAVGATHTATPSPSASPTASPSATATPSTTTSGAIPKDTGGEYIAITSPASGATVDRDVVVSGKARVFEAAFTVDVTQNGVVVQSQPVTASIGAPSMGVWSTVFHLSPGKYKVEAYELSAKGDGSKAATDTIWITVR